MNSDNIERPPDPSASGHRPSSELWEPWEIADETTQPLVNKVHSAEQRGLQDGETSPPHVEEPFAGSAAVALDPQFSYREHVTGSLAAHPAEAALFQPAYSPYPAPMYPQQGQTYPPQPVYQGYPGYPTAYAPSAGYAGSPTRAYPPYVYAQQPPQPKRDGYLLAMAIASLVGSSLVLLVGLVFTGLLLLAIILPNKTLNASQLFNVDAAIVLFICVGIFGGSFGIYHSIRSLLQKPSAAFSLPWFWIFLVLYLAVVASGFVLRSSGQEVAFPGLSATLIVLTGIFPALAVAALGVRRLRTRAVKPLKGKWQTSWRRFTLAALSGATLSVSLAGVLEFVLLVVLVLFTHVQGMQNMASCINTPDVHSCQNAGAYSILFLTIAVIAPLVEETVKPLAVVLLIGRVRSAAEAFVLGLACGIGFDIVETSLYISSGYHDWLTVALTRTGAGLLHGFGAAMVALGWYYLVHAKELGYRKALLRAFACWLYAVFQHAVWNGSASVVLLPGPVGRFLQNWTLNLGFTALPFDVVTNIIESLLILTFFIYLTGKLRGKPASPTPAPPASEERKDTLIRPSEAMASA